MPPTDPVDPPKGDIMPNPNDILILGGNRWLSIAGQILSTEFGDPVGLTLNTLAFWEAAALRGTGKPLSELFAWLGMGKNDSARVRELEMLEDLFYDAQSDNQQAGQNLKGIEERINNLKTDLVIELGGDGCVIDPVD
jgi:hypothetical protein